MLRSRSFVFAVLVFAATRVWLLGFFEPKLNADVLLYFRYAVDGIDLGYSAYRETDLEYPPVAWWTIAAPRLWASQPFYRSYLHTGSGDMSDFHREYLRRFRALMAGFDLASFALLLAIVARRRPELLAVSAWGYTLVTALQPHVLYDRLDLGVLFCVLLWAWCWNQAADCNHEWIWKSAAYAALGVGIAYKLIPVVMVPVCLTVDGYVAGGTGRWRTLVAGSLALAITALGPFVYYFLIAGPGVFRLFAYHGERGLEIESVWASLILPLKWLGVAMSVSHGHGSINLDSPWSMPLARASLPALFIMVGGAMFAAWRQAAANASLAGYRLGFMALLGAVVVAKVLSVQYLVWTLPTLLLLGCEVTTLVGYRWWIAMLAVIAGLSTLLYPYLFFLEIPWGTTTIVNPWPLAPELHPVACGVLIVRNLLLVGAVGLVVYRVWATPVGPGESLVAR